MSATFDPAGPIAELRKLGIEPRWPKQEKVTVYRERRRWEYELTFIADTALRDLAHLIVDGWTIHIHPVYPRIRIRIERPNKENS
ncbi:hypothetical protein [Microbacterium aquimaris]|uniref:Uncharacterized protein n=1 Tax=Microbacterium aquimaris TaxID=459816 RepID=A0ABU5N8A4_9MICO|nr:hypothetical protein [Microbacterium aquimaris]MDZ8162344.1 hypothetical protein [Microbacterium aquimaris]